MPGEAAVVAAAVEVVKDAAQMTAWDHMYAAKAATDIAKVKPLVVAEEAVKKEAAVLAEHNQGLGAKILHTIEQAALDVVGMNQAPAPEQPAAPQATSPEQSPPSTAPAPTQEAHPHESALTAIELHAANIEGHLATMLKEFVAKVRSGEESFTDEVKGELEKIGVKF